MKKMIVGLLIALNIGSAQAKTADIAGVIVGLGALLTVLEAQKHKKPPTEEERKKFEELQKQGGGSGPGSK